MLITNPFAEISTLISPTVMQVYVIVMIVLVAAGTLFDVWYKKSARYFSQNWKHQQSKGSRQVGTGEVASLAVKTLCVEVLTSAEFCSARRRIAHLLTMYGFVVYVVTAAIMIFQYPTAAQTPAIWPFLWHLGALMVCIGGYWFWFFIRADVAAEGNSPFRVVRADLFVLSLLASTTFALLWSATQSMGASLCATVLFGLYILSTTVLFGSVPWSKFAHMFFKPAAALQKRVAEADGSRSNLPAPADKPEVFGSTRRLPQHY